MSGKSEKATVKRTLHQLKVLFKKNFLLQSRHADTTAFMFLVPALLSSLLLLGRGQVEPTQIENVTRWDSFTVDPAQDVTYWAAEEQGFCSFGTEDDESGADEPLLLVFSPNTNVTNAFMADLKQMIAGGDASGQIGILGKACPFGGHRDIELRGFDTSADLDKFMKAGGEASNVFYGIDFKNQEWFSNSSFPKTLDYALRPVATPRSETGQGEGWVTNILYSRDAAQNGPTDKDSEYGGMPFYYKDLFLEMQHLIDYLYM